MKLKTILCSATILSISFSAEARESFYNLRNTQPSIIINLGALGNLESSVPVNRNGTGTLGGGSAPAITASPVYDQSLIKQKLPLHVTEAPKPVEKPISAPKVIEPIEQPKLVEQVQPKTTKPELPKLSEATKPNEPSKEPVKLEPIVKPVIDLPPSPPVHTKAPPPAPEPAPEKPPATKPALLPKGPKVVVSSEDEDKPAPIVEVNKDKPIPAPVMEVSKKPLPLNTETVKPPQSDRVVSLPSIAEATKPNPAEITPPPAPIHKAEADIPPLAPIHKTEPDLPPPPKPAPAAKPAPVLKAETNIPPPSAKPAPVQKTESDLPPPPKPTPVAKPAPVQKTESDLPPPPKPVEAKPTKSVPANSTKQNIAEPDLDAIETPYTSIMDSQPETNNKPAPAPSKPAAENPAPKPAVAAKTITKTSTVTTSEKPSSEPAILKPVVESKTVEKIVMPDNSAKPVTQTTTTTTTAPKPPYSLSGPTETAPKTIVNTTTTTIADNAAPKPVMKTITAVEPTPPVAKTVTVPTTTTTTQTELKSIMPQTPAATPPVNSATLEKPTPHELPPLASLFDKPPVSAATITGAAPAQTPAPAPAASMPSKDAVIVQPQQIAQNTAPILPTSTNGGAAMTIIYSEAATELPAAEKAKLDGIITQLNANKTARLAVVSYASGTPDQASQAKRTALARALAVHTYLLEHNISKDRIDVKPLGNKSENGVPDRVDIFLDKGGRS